MSRVSSERLHALRQLQHIRRKYAGIWGHEYTSGGSRAKQMKRGRFGGFHRKSWNQNNSARRRTQLAIMIVPTHGPFKPRCTLQPSLNLPSPSLHILLLALPNVERRTLIIFPLQGREKRRETPGSRAMEWNEVFVRVCFKNLVVSLELEAPRG